MSKNYSINPSYVDGKGKLTNAGKQLLLNLAKTNATQMFVYDENYVRSTKDDEQQDTEVTQTKILLDNLTCVNYIYVIDEKNMFFVNSFEESNGMFISIAHDDYIVLYDGGRMTRHYTGTFTGIKYGPNGGDRFYIRKQRPDLIKGSIGEYSYTVERLIKICYDWKEGLLGFDVSEYDVNVRDLSGGFNTQCEFNLDGNFHPSNLEYCTKGDNTRHSKLSRKIYKMTGHIWDISANDKYLSIVVANGDVEFLIDYLEASGYRRCN